MLHAFQAQTLPGGRGGTPSVTAFRERESLDIPQASLRHAAYSRRPSLSSNETMQVTLILSLPSNPPFRIQIYGD